MPSTRHHWPAGGFVLGVLMYSLLADAQAAQAAAPRGIVWLCGFGV